MFKKHDTVFYVSGHDQIVKAVVLVAHKDGSAKVEAQWFYHEGKDVGPYIGSRHELAAPLLFINAMEADNHRSSKIQQSAS